MEKTYTMDLHTHLIEKKTKPRAFWKQAIKVKLNAVAITEHADKKPEKAYLELKKCLPEGMVLIPGIEVNCKYGHVIGLGEDEGIYNITELYKKNIAVNDLLGVAEENDIMLSVAHPWGLSHDSFAYNYGADKLEELIIKKNIGIEVYNGILGHLTDFIYDSGWVKKPTNFFDFLDKNRVARKAGIGMLAGKIKRKIDKKSVEIVIRCANAIELGEKARFITAGSDAHSSDRVGTGILKIKSNEYELTNQNVLGMLRKKENVIWSGPLVREVEPGMYERVGEKINRLEILQGLEYATRKIVGKTSKKVKKKIRKKKED